MKFLSLFFVLGLALFGNSKLHVCYTKKIISESTGNVAYVGCKRYHDSCDSNGKLHFGKYPSSSKALSALNRCIDSSPKFVDSGHKNTSTDGQVYNLDPNGDGFLSLRAKPKGREIGKLYNGNKVKILKKKGKYYKVKVVKSGMVGYAHGNWIRKSHTSNSSNTSTSHKQGTVHGLDPNGDGFLSLRNKPKGREIGKLYNGDRIDILATRGKWYKVKLANSGQVGWAHGNWINKEPSSLTRENIMSQIDKLRFRYDYDCPKLGKYRKDKKVIEALLFNNGDLFKCADNSLKKDRKFILNTIKKVYDKYPVAADSEQIFKHIDIELQNDKKFVLEAVKINGEILQYANLFKKDRDVVLAALKQNYCSLKYTDTSLFTKDREILLAAIPCTGNEFKIADESLQNDREFVLNAIKKNGLIFEDLQEQFRSDKEIILNALISSENPTMLSNAGKDIKNDKEFIFRAINILPSLSDNTIADTEIYIDSKLVEKLNSEKKYIEVLKSYKHNIDDCAKLPKDLLEIDEFAWYALKIDPSNIVCLPQTKERILYALSQSGGKVYLSAVKKSFWEDRDFLLKAVKYYGSALDYAPNNLKKDKEIVLAAVKESGYAIRYADNSLRDNKKLILSAVSNTYSNTLSFASDRLKDDKEVVMTAVKKNGDNLQYASTRLKQDKEVVTIAVTQNHEVLDFVDASLRKDIEVVMASGKNNKEALKYIEERKKIEYALQHELPKIKKNIEKMFNKTILNTTYDFVFSDIFGNNIHISNTAEGFDIPEFSGKKVLINLTSFFKVCSSCSRQRATLIKLQKKYQDELRILSIGANTLLDKTHGNEFFFKNKINYPIIGKTPEKFMDYIKQRAKWSEAVPFFLILDTNHQVQFVNHGMLNYEEMEEVFKQIK